MIYDILLGFSLLLFLGVGLAWYISGKVIKQPREIKKEKWKQYALWPQTVSFKSRDGLRLAGVFIQGSNEKTIILLHGYGRSKEQMLPQAGFLNKAGYNIFMFDFRGSGESEGKFITFGQREQFDLEAAVEYLKMKPGIKADCLGLLGFSMGGAVALMKSGDLPQIKAIAICSTFARFKSVIWQNFQEYLKGVPFFPLGYLTLWIMRVRTGIYYPRINPITYLHKLQKRPLMVIHGAHDKKIPVEDAMEICKHAPWLKEFWLVRTGDHDDLYSLSKEEYQSKIRNFFNQYLS